MTQDQMIVNYLEDDTLAPEAEDDMAYAAAIAFARMVDETATVADLAAYRTWMTYCRLRGDPEHTMIGAVNVAADWARKLGVA